MPQFAAQHRKHHKYVQNQQKRPAIAVTAALQNRSTGKNVSDTLSNRLFSSLCCKIVLRADMWRYYRRCYCLRRIRNKKVELCPTRPYPTSPSRCLEILRFCSPTVAARSSNEGPRNGYWRSCYWKMDAISSTPFSLRGYGRTLPLEIITFTRIFGVCAAC